MNQLIDHDLVPEFEFQEIVYEERPVLDRQGAPMEGLHQVWIWLDNERQLNSYTTGAVKEVILAFRRASADRRAVAVVFTAKGTRSFCTGGNTAEYATYYSGRPLEYAQYMRLFNDMVTSILLCDKPVICRVNGMRIGGGQEIGMACDFSVSGDHARFGQAGPVHGSAPDGGSTDFLHLYVGYARAAESLVLCGQPWSALKAQRVGLLNRIVPVHRDRDGAWAPNPMVVTDEAVDAFGNSTLGEWREGAAKDAAKQRVKELSIDLSRLDEAVNELVTALAHTFPDCTHKTLESLRKKKLEHWYANSETNRSWLALNMNTEAMAGFNAFHHGDRGEREINFGLLRRRYAEGVPFTPELAAEVMLPSAREGFEKSQR